MALPSLLTYDVESEQGLSDVPPGLSLALEPRFPQDPAQDERLSALMGRYTTASLHGVAPAAFRSHVEGALGTIDAEIEGYAADEIHRQRDLSIRFHWGHDHDFGDFSVSGRMGRRHLTLMRNFMHAFPVDDATFAGRDVLDVGCWTGGTTLLLAALGARVTALEEVRKYARMAQYLLDSFGVPGRVLDHSLYALDAREAYDVIYVPGVIYHLSDPLLALRLLCNATRVGGCILVESEGINVAGALCRYEGSVLTHSGSQEELSRGGWNWYSPSPLALARLLWGAGFDDISIAWMDNRVYAHARKTCRSAITRAGLSRPDVP
ncbi:class I SAM-dependent methyltransferase [Pararhodospirillum oryzae]|uniref:Methyltransferase domain-containing protein n=1 Tax=Pararhodospirillum oryzae TaxID=478448 RepID=A0A512H7V9_9PROT|nr:class I SAM-dependent methyltransferase [Pararhodospirillum oryzae]GEO81521.1 hypothetical protein ROR02_16520 [Pararhodospirillum oryzae]